MLRDCVPVLSTCPLHTYSGGGKERRILIEMAIFHTGGVFSYLPHHLDLALEDSVGHSTCMSVLARRRAIMGWLVG